MIHTVLPENHFKTDIAFVARILLNLSRSLLKLAELDTGPDTALCIGEKTSSTKYSRQERYRSAAVLGCSISLAELQYHAQIDNNAAETSALIEKARIVRARAFFGLRKWPNATVDAKKVLALNAASGEAQSLLADIAAVKKHNKVMDKRLSREVSRWVHAATNSSNGAQAMDRMDGLVSGHQPKDVGSSVPDEHATRNKVDQTWDNQRGRVGRFCIEICSVLVFVVAMWVVYPNETFNTAKQYFYATR